MKHNGVKHRLGAQTKLVSLDVDMDGPWKEERTYAPPESVNKRLLEAAKSYVESLDDMVSPQAEFQRLRYEKLTALRVAIAAAEKEK